VEATWQAAPYLPWPKAIDHAEAKWEAARSLAALVEEGQVIGIGSGSSAYLALRAIAARSAEEHLGIKVATSSQETDIAASHLGLPLARLGDAALSWMVDGADEVDPAGRFLKGRGGALFKEKLLWATCERRYVAIDASKRVAALGSRFPVPIEVHPNAVGHLVGVVESLGAAHASLRVGEGKDGPVITESGFVILEARFQPVPEGLHEALKRVPGVLETGIFEGYRAELVESHPGGPASGPPPSETR
jgi:ribose 5-phosphate isomerase A